MTTLNRHADALHRPGSWLFGEDVAGSKFHSGRSRPTSRQARYFRPSRTVAACHQSRSMG